MELLEDLCMELKRCPHREKDKCNEIVCVKKVLERRIGNDENKKTKLEVEIAIFNERKKQSISKYALGVSSVSVILVSYYNLLKDVNMDAYAYFMIGIIITALIYIIPHIVFEFSDKKEWVKYIEITLEKYFASHQ